MKVKTTWFSDFLTAERTCKSVIQHKRSTGICHGFYLIPAACVLITLFFWNSASAEDKNQLVRLAKLQIDPSRLESYKAALKEEIETSLRIEPGVLTLYAVSEKDNPTHITILEIYADTVAYKAHLQTPHFIKYKSLTKEMVKSLELVETIPIVPGMQVKVK